MDSVLNPDVLLPIATFLAGALFMLIVRGLDKVIDSFTRSSNKYDDVLIPYVQAIKAALEATPKKEEPK